MNELNYLDGIAIATELSFYGVRCSWCKTNDGAVVITHFFRLSKPEDILKLNRAVKILEATLGKAITRSETVEPRVFGLEFTKDKTGVLNLDKRLKQATPYKLLVGEATDGTCQMIDLDETPHLLIAGCTGSGKSVLLNNFVKCIIEQNKKGNFYKPLIIDTKKVGFAKYDGVKYTQVATDVYDAVDMLKWAVITMEKRYSQMVENNIDKWQDWRIVIIIDEFSDLIMEAKKSIEPLVVKLAQKGRACGIHLIIATQRPTVTVVTGNLKANIADRIALRVSSVRDSLVILEQKGAEKLKGKGDSIVKINGETKRVQCFYSK